GHPRESRRPRQSPAGGAARIPSPGFARLMYAFAKVDRRANKTCPVHCGQDDPVAYSEHQSSTTPFRRRDLRRERSPFVEKFEFHARALDEADAKNRSHAAFLEVKYRSWPARSILFVNGIARCAFRSRRRRHCEPRSVLCQ